MGSGELIFLFLYQVAVEDCTGCRLCVEVCPAKYKSKGSRKSLNMGPQMPIRNKARPDWEFFVGLPDMQQSSAIKFNNVRNGQLLQPLFGFSGLCAGCGETPYIKLLTQLFGDKLNSNESDSFTGSREFVLETSDAHEMLRAVQEVLH